MEVIEFSEDEFLAARAVINRGLSKAAESLTFFMKENVSYQGMNFSMAPVGKTQLSNKPGDNIHLLITNVIGDLKGVCCLIFSKEEVDKLCKAALPPEVTENPALLKEMSDAIMLEVDNIISASVITQFANMLECRIYGGVPELRKHNEEGLGQALNDMLEKDLYLVRFNTQFNSAVVDFNPEFLWLFDSSFMSSVRNFACKQGAEMTAAV